MGHQPTSAMWKQLTRFQRFVYVYGAVASATFLVGSMFRVRALQMIGVLLLSMVVFSGLFAILIAVPLSYLGKKAKPEGQEMRRSRMKPGGS